MELIKICTKCNIEQPICNFGKYKIAKDGLRHQCKSCRKDETKKYREANPEKNKEWHKANPSYSREQAIKYYSEKPDKVKESNEKWRKANLDKYKKSQKDSRKNNKQKENENQKKRRKANPHVEAWRCILHNTLVRIGKKKEGRTIDLLGYSALDLQNHITRLFTDGMTWDNYGEWHIDHIIGVIKFPKDTPMNIVNALSNLQPLWATTREINGVIYEGNLNKG